MGRFGERAVFRENGVNRQIRTRGTNAWPKSPTFDVAEDVAPVPGKRRGIPHRRAVRNDGGRRSAGKVKSSTRDGGVRLSGGIRQ